MGKYQVIFLDIDNTLLDFSSSEEKSFCLTLDQYNLNEYHHLYPLYKDINEQLWIEFEKGTLDKDFIVIERFNSLFSLYNLKIDLERFNRDFLLNLAKFPILIDNAINLLDKLKGKYYLIAISNGVSFAFRRRLFKANIITYFDNIVTSEEAGFSKPDPKIFEYVLKKSNLLDVNKEKCIILGDSFSSDIKGGINFNIDTCFYNPSNNINETLIKPTFVIKDLMEFIDVIEGSNYES